MLNRILQRKHATAIALTVLTLAGAVGQSRASTLYYDPNGSSPGTLSTTSRPWSTSTSDTWWNTSTGGGSGTLTYWTDGNDAYFYQGQYNTAVSGTVTVNSITVSANGSGKYANIGGSGTINLTGGIILAPAGNVPDLTISAKINLASGAASVVWGETATSGSNAKTINISGNIGESVAGSGFTLNSASGSNKAMSINLSGTNTYTGGTTITNGSIIATSDSALGHGNVNVGTSGTLTLQNATNNNYLYDAGSLFLTGSAKVNLNFTGIDTIAGLYFNNVQQAAGTWGAVGSGAQHTSSSFIGTGMIYVPEPASLALLVLGGTLILAQHRRRRAL